MKLKIELFRYGNVVFGKVLEQDETLRNGGDIAAAESGFIVRSGGEPQLLPDRLYIRGFSESKDNNAFCYQSSTEATAKQICQTIVELVDEINGVSKEDENAIERVL